MRKHDWMIGLLTELESYSEKNEMPRTMRAIYNAIEIAVDEQRNLRKSGNVLYLTDYNSVEPAAARDNVISTYAEQLLGLLNEP